MKKLLLILFSTLICNIVVGQSLAKLDEKNGFRNLKLGTHISNYKGLEEHTGQDNDEYKRYSLNNDKKYIGDLYISTPVYNFYKSRLYEVRIFPTENDTQKFVKLYKSLYGNPTVTYQDPLTGQDCTLYTWKGKKVILQYFVYKSNIISDMVIYTSRPIQSQIKKDLEMHQKSKQQKRINDM